MGRDRGDDAGVDTRKSGRGGAEQEVEGGGWRLQRHTTRHAVEPGARLDVLADDDRGTLLKA
ncbi:hypothetical protein B1218_36150, partial [Pseudomonas ogarae]